jgi:hypothetical protein
MSIAKDDNNKLTDEGINASVESGSQALPVDEQQLNDKKQHENRDEEINKANDLNDMSLPGQPG